MADEHPSRFWQLTHEQGNPRHLHPLHATNAPIASRNILVVVIVLVALVGSLFCGATLSTYESTDDAQVDVHLYPVSARISGYVTKVNVDDNQVVQKGTVLVEIDPERLRGCGRIGTRPILRVRKLRRNL